MCRYGALPRLSADQIAHAFGVLPAATVKADVTAFPCANYVEEPRHDVQSHQAALPPPPEYSAAGYQHQEPVVIPAPEEPSVTVTILGTTDAKYRVPVSRILHMPTVPQRVRVLCPMFDPEHPHESCMMGDSCHHVHADVRGLVVICAHVNYAWRSLEDCAYARHPAGDVVQIAAPNSSVHVDVMDTGSLLVTKALESNRRPLTHCAHYYLNRRCNLGPDCRFVHAVFVNENARPRQRAPAPVQLGREVLPTRRSELTAQGAEEPAHETTIHHVHHEAPSAVHAAVLAAEHPMPKFTSHSSDHGSSLHTATQSVSSGATTPNVLRSTSPVYAVQRRWRHDPYSAATFVNAL